MKRLKQKTLRIFFCVEILVLSVLFVLGDNGLPAIIRIRRENNALIKDIEALKQENDALEYELVQWNEQSFNKEKIARELLQMAKKDEIIYFVS